MDIIRGRHTLKPKHRGAVVTIGNFDGLHLGHRAIIKQLRDLAVRDKSQTMLITFEPQPHEYFNPATAPARLTNLREKISHSQALGIDNLLCLAFNAELANLPADVFIENFLVGQLGIRGIVVGSDFRFGKDRTGDVDYLKRAGNTFGFTVQTVENHEIASQRVSSTRIRGYLEQADFRQAAELLGRPYRICGRVCHGDKLGRELGFHTANVALARVRAACQGVFIAKAYLPDGSVHPAAANLGTRPTRCGMKTLLEVHLLNYSGDLYGQFLQIEFIEKIRNEKKFATIDELKQQIAADISQATAYFQT